ncbi:MAG: menaquinone biosynthesis protein [Ferruginibacter sp.]
MDRKIRVGAVSYLNTKPLIYGFEQGMLKDEIDLRIDYPSNIGKQLKNDEIDIGLVPVAILPEMANYHIISDYCISCDGPVASVCLFSDVPINEIKTIILDYQSKTSVALLKILIKEYWNISPELIDGKNGYEENINGITAGLVIGDRAFDQRLKSPYIYDLGEAWKAHTGLPFVFAAWVSNKDLPPDFIEKFNQANDVGFQYMDRILANHPFSAFNLQEYYSRNIKFKPQFDKLKVITLFLEKLKNNK